VKKPPNAKLQPSEAAKPGAMNSVATTVAPHAAWTAEAMLPAANAQAMVSRLASMSGHSAMNADAIKTKGLSHVKTRAKTHSLPPAKGPAQALAATPARDSVASVATGRSRTEAKATTSATPSAVTAAAPMAMRTPSQAPRQFKLPPRAKTTAACACPSS
jgi:hypothetical protein